MISCVAVIQARLGSTRLKNKVLADICGKPMLVRVIERVKMCKEINEVVVAFPDCDAGALSDLVIDAGASACAGHLDPQDVLGRIYFAADLFKADVIVRVTADCPLFDPGEVTTLLWTFKGHKTHIGFMNVDVPHRQDPSEWSIRDKRKNCFPEGLDCEVITMRTLGLAQTSAVVHWDREHVTPWIYRQPNRFKSICAWPDKEDYAGLKWSVDTAADLEFARAVYSDLGDSFVWRDVIALLNRKPELLEINGQTWRPRRGVALGPA